MSDFASEYGIRLHSVDLSWMEFLDLLHGLMSTDSRIARHFHEEDA